MWESKHCSQPASPIQETPPLLDCPPRNDPETARKVRRAHCQAKHVVDSMGKYKLMTILENFRMTTGKKGKDKDEMTKQIARTYRVRKY